jgi:hypothetical protein
MGEGQERWSEWVVNMGVVGVWDFFPSYMLVH